MPITAISRDWGVDPSIVRITTTDNLAAITTNGYLNTQAAVIESIQHGDFQWSPTDIVAIVYNGGQGQFAYDAINSTFILDTQALGPNSVNTVNIVDQAVTAAKIANATITDLQISPTAAIQGPKIAAGTITQTQIASYLMQYDKAVLTSAAFRNMYTAPVQLLPAPGVGNLIVVRQVVFSVIFANSAYANGGNIALQYGAAAAGAGVLACNVISAATVNAWSVSSSISVDGLVANSSNVNTVNQALYISNDTAPFITGNSTVHLQIWYAIVIL